MMAEIKLTVTDDFFPLLSDIEIREMCDDWRRADCLGLERLMAHRLTGYGYIALADKRHRDAADYFCLARVMLNRAIVLEEKTQQGETK